MQIKRKKIFGLNTDSTKRQSESNFSKSVSSILTKIIIKSLECLH